MMNIGMASKNLNLVSSECYLGTWHMRVECGIYSGMANGWVMNRQATHRIGGISNKSEKMKWLSSPMDVPIEWIR